MSVWHLTGLIPDIENHHFDYQSCAGRTRPYLLTGTRQWMLTDALQGKNSYRIIDFQSSNDTTTIHYFSDDRPTLNGQVNHLNQVFLSNA
jgi:hypothetical protein